MTYEELIDYCSKRFCNECNYHALCGRFRKKYNCTPDSNIDEGEEEYKNHTAIYFCNLADVN